MTNEQIFKTLEKAIEALTYFKNEYRNRSSIVSSEKCSECRNLLIDASRILAAYDYAMNDKINL